MATTGAESAVYDCLVLFLSPPGCCFVFLRIPFRLIISTDGLTLGLSRLTQHLFCIGTVLFVQFSPGIAVLEKGIGDAQKMLYRLI